MKFVEIEYLKRAIYKHVTRYFHKDAVDAYEKTNIIWVDWNKIENLPTIQPGTILIPIPTKDIKCSEDLNSAQFRNTTINFWGKFVAPKKNWSIDKSSNLWLTNGNESYMPSWNMAAILFDLLSMKEEVASKERDNHQRFTAKMSRNITNALSGLANN